MFIAQILHIPDAKQCRCPEKFIEIFGFCERTKFWTFWFWHADRGRALQVDSAMRIPRLVWDARFGEIAACSDSSQNRAQILHAPSLLWAAPPSPCLPAWLPRMSTSRVLSIQESAQHVLGGGGVLVLLSWEVGDQLNWANPESSMAQLDRGSLDHHLVLIPLIEAIVSF